MGSLWTHFLGLVWLLKNERSQNHAVFLVSKGWNPPIFGSLQDPRCARMPHFVQVLLKIQHFPSVLTRSISATSVRTEFFYTTGSSSASGNGVALFSDSSEQFFDRLAAVCDGYGAVAIVEVLAVVDAEGCADCREEVGDADRIGDDLLGSLVRFSPGAAVL